MKPYTTPDSYFVQATNTAGCTADSHTFMVTGPNQLSADIGFTIYPNPVSNYNLVRITAGADATGQTIQMFDTEGRLVLTSKINNPGYRDFHWQFSPGFIPGKRGRCI